MRVDHCRDVGIVDPRIHNPDSSIVDRDDGVVALGGDVRDQSIRVIVRQGFPVDSLGRKGVDEDNAGVRALINNRILVSEVPGQVSVIFVCLSRECVIWSGDIWRSHRSGTTTRDKGTLGRDQRRAAVVVCLQEEGNDLTFRNVENVVPESPFSDGYVRVAVAGSRTVITEQRKRSWLLEGQRIIDILNKDVALDCALEDGCLGCGITGVGERMRKSQVDRNAETWVLPLGVHVPGGYDTSSHVVEPGLRQSTVGDGLGEVSGPEVRVGHGSVKASLGRGDTSVLSAPVRDDEALEAELSLQETVEGLGVLACYALLAASSLVYRLTIAYRSCCSACCTST